MQHQIYSFIVDESNRVIGIQILNYWINIVSKAEFYVFFFSTCFFSSLKRTTKRCRSSILTFCVGFCILIFLVWIVPEQHNLLGHNFVSSFYKLKLCINIIFPYVSSIPCSGALFLVDTDNQIILSQFVVTSTRIEDEVYVTTETNYFNMVSFFCCSFGILFRGVYRTKTVQYFAHYSLFLFSLGCYYAMLLTHVCLSVSCVVFFVYRMLMRSVVVLVFLSDWYYVWMYSIPLCDIWHYVQI